MVRHVILWTLRPGLSEAECQRVKEEMKQGLEALVGVVPGLRSATVHTEGRLPSSTADIMLDSTLESEEALRAYAVHPAHVAVAEEKVKPYVSQRVCLDFEVEG